MINFKEQQEIKQVATIEKVTITDIDRRVPKPGETKIILTRHGEYEKEDKKILGKLTKKGKKESYNTTKLIMDEMVAQISEKERNQLRILVVGSPTQYGGKNGGQRSVETSQETLRAIEDVIKEYNMDIKQIINIDKNINTKTGIKERALENKENGVQPRIMFDTEEPRIFSENDEYLQFLIKKYGQDTQQFWQHFEEDTHHDIRKKMGAEGPSELLKRYAHSIKVLARFARKHQIKNGKKNRLIIMGVSHYDTISPFLKNYVLPEKKQSDYLPIDFNAGFAIDLDNKNNCSVTLRGQKYDIKL